MSPPRGGLGRPCTTRYATRRKVLTVAGRRFAIARTRADAYDLSQFDADGDETVTEAEVRAQVEALAADLGMLYSGPPPEQCRPPAPPPGAQVVLLGGYEGAGLSSVALDGMDSVTTAGTLDRTR